MNKGCVDLLNAMCVKREKAEKVSEGFTISKMNNYPVK